MPIPATDTSMPQMTTIAFHWGSSGLGQATTPSKTTLTVEIS